MRAEYERLSIRVTEFDTEDVITTSGMLPDDPTDPTTPVNPDSEVDNAYASAGDLGLSGPWGF